MIMREFGSQIGFEFDKKDFLSDFINQNQFSDFQRTAREALYLCAEYLKTKFGVKKIYMPALSCESMYKPFIMLSYEVEFYSVNEKFEPILNNISKHSIIFYMLYYGINNLNDIQKEIFKHTDCFSIVDITHYAFDREAYNLICDYKVLSLRKTLGIIDGGVLLSDKHLLNKTKHTDNEYSRLREKAFEKKTIYDNSKIKEIKEEYRSFLSAAEKLVDKEIKPIGAGEKSLDYIKNLNVTNIKNKRKANYLKLYKELKNLNKLKLISDENLSDKSVPFAFPVIVNNRDEIQKKLAQNNVYAQVLWPICEEAKKKDIFAKMFSENMLALPIDQRYDIEDMSEMAERIKRVLL